VLITASLAIEIKFQITGSPFRGLFYYRKKHIFRERQEREDAIASSNITS
jgi:hypothetical protein